MGISGKEKRIHAVGISRMEENTCCGYKWEGGEYILWV